MQKVALATIVILLAPVHSVHGQVDIGAVQAVRDDSWQQRCMALFLEPDSMKPEESLYWNLGISLICNPPEDIPDLFIRFSASCMAAYAEGIPPESDPLVDSLIGEDGFISGDLVDNPLPPGILPNDNPCRMVDGLIGDGGGTSPGPPDPPFDPVVPELPAWPGLPSVPSIPEPPSAPALPGSPGAPQPPAHNPNPPGDNPGPLPPGGTIPTVGALRDYAIGVPCKTYGSWKQTPAYGALYGGDDKVGGEHAQWMEDDIYVQFALRYAACVNGLPAPPSLGLLFQALVDVAEMVETQMGTTVAEAIDDGQNLHDGAMRTAGEAYLRDDDASAVRNRGSPEAIADGVVEVVLARDLIASPKPISSLDGLGLYELAVPMPVHGTLEQFSSVDDPGSDGGSGNRADATGVECAIMLGLMATAIVSMTVAPVGWPLAAAAATALGSAAQSGITCGKWLTGGDYACDSGVSVDWGGIRGTTFTGAIFSSGLLEIVADSALDGHDDQEFPFSHTDLQSYDRGKATCQKEYQSALEGAKQAASNFHPLYGGATASATVEAIPMEVNIAEQINEIWAGDDIGFGSIADQTPVILVDCTSLSCDHVLRLIISDCGTAEVTVASVVEYLFQGSGKCTEVTVDVGGQSRTIEDIPGVTIDVEVQAEQAG